MRYWQEIAERLAAEGWTWGCTKRVDSNGRTIFVADACNADGKRFAVRSDDKLLAFLELERQILADPAPAPSLIPSGVSSTPPVLQTKTARMRKRSILAAAAFAAVFGLWAGAAYLQYTDRSRPPGGIFEATRKPRSGRSSGGNLTFWSAIQSQFRPSDEKSGRGRSPCPKSHFRQPD